MKGLLWDMTDSGLQSWAEGLSARERVREIATTLTQQRSVNWVKEEAGISSWQTAKEELEMLVEFGQLRAVEGEHGNRRYAPNYQRRYFDELAALINEHTREQLREQIAEIQERIEEWQSEFGVESRSDLEATLTDEDLVAEQIRERNAVLRRWEQYEDNRRLLRHALELYDDARTVQREDEKSRDSPVST
jgi:hypothetical protein